MTTLLPYQPEYLDPFWSWRHQELSQRFNPLRDLKKSEIELILSSELSDLSTLVEKVTYRWFFECDGCLAGHVLMKEVNPAMKTAEIGYMVDERFYGKGLTTLAVKHLIQKIFKETDLRKLWAVVHVENIGSIRVLEKNGFQKEGVLRKHYLIKGLPQDQYIFGLLKEEMVVK